MSNEERVDLADPADLDRLHLVLLRLNRRIRVSSHDEISPSQRSILGTVYRFGPVSVGRIAEREHVQPPSASKIVAALEQLGLVQRAADPNDRRCSLISLTQQGRDLVDEMRTAALGFLSSRLAELDPRDLETLESSLPALERLLGSGDELGPAGASGGDTAKASRT